MDVAPNPASPPAAADPDPVNPSSSPLEPIHVAFTADRELNILASTLSQFAIMGAVYFLIVIIYAFLSLIGFPPQFFIFFILALGIIIAAYVLLRLHKRNRQWKKARDGLSSDPSRRLRLVGDGLATDRFLPSIQTDEAIEPYIAFSYLGVSHFPDTLRPDGTPRNPEIKPSHPASKPSHKFTYSNPLLLPGHVREVGHGPLYTALMLLFIAMFYGVIYLTQHYIIRGSPLPFIMSLGASLFLTSILLAWLTPTYIRISPHKFEILRFGWVPKGTPAYELWDLKTSNLLVDLRSGNIRIWDEAKPARRGVLLRSLLILTHRQRLARALFLAARTHHPQVPLPTDSLVG